MHKRKKEKIFWKSCFGVTSSSLVPEVLGRLPWKEANITDKHLEFLSNRVKSVSQMDLDYTLVTNQGVQHLAEMRIKELRLKGLNIDDASIKYLQQIEGLTLLHIGNTNISSLAIRSLGQISTLETLICTPDPVDLKDLREFKEMLPKCELIVNNQLFQG